MLPLIIHFDLPLSGDHSTVGHNCPCARLPEPHHAACTVQHVPRAIQKSTFVHSAHVCARSYFPPDLGISSWAEGHPVVVGARRDARDDVTASTKQQYEGVHLIGVPCGGCMQPTAGELPVANPMLTRRLVSEAADA